MPGLKIVVWLCKTTLQQYASSVYPSYVAIPNCLVARHAIHESLKSKMICPILQITRLSAFINYLISFQNFQYS